MSLTVLLSHCESFQAQVVSSDATKNIPFSLKPSTDKKVALDFTLNETYKKKVEDEKKEESKSDIAIVEVPKETVEFVNIGSYRISQNMEHMPLVSIVEAGKIVTFCYVIRFANHVSSLVHLNDSKSTCRLALGTKDCPRQIKDSDRDTSSIQIIEP